MFVRNLNLGGDTNRFRCKIDSLFEKIIEQHSILKKSLNHYTPVSLRSISCFVQDFMAQFKTLNNLNTQMSKTKIIYHMDCAFPFVGEIDMKNIVP